MKVTEATATLVVIKAVRLGLGCFDPARLQMGRHGSPPCPCESLLFVLVGASEVLGLHF